MKYSSILIVIIIILIIITILVLIAAIVYNYVKNKIDKLDTKSSITNKLSSSFPKTQSYIAYTQSVSDNMIASLDAETNANYNLQINLSELFDNTTGSLSLINANWETFFPSIITSSNRINSSFFVKDDMNNTFLAFLRIAVSANLVVGNSLGTYTIPTISSIISLRKCLNQNTSLNTDDKPLYPTYDVAPLDSFKYDIDSITINNAKYIFVPLLIPANSGGGLFSVFLEFDETLPNFLTKNHTTVDDGIEITIKCSIFM